jgi:tetratricopeptide (TPR) repeat protein
LAGPPQARTLTLWETVLSAVALVGEYCTKLVWPLPLSAYYPFHKSTGLFEPAVLTGLAWLVAGGVGFLVLRRRSRAAAFAILWVIVPLAPVLNARWLVANVFAERYLYLPSAGFCWLVAWAGIRLWDALPASRPLGRRILAAAFVVVCMLFAARTVMRNRDWRNDLTLYQRALEVFPEAHVLRGNLGGMYLNRGDFAAAERELKLSIAHNPDNVITLQNLGVLYAGQQRHADAIAMFERVLRLRPEYTAAHYNLCGVYRKMGEVDQALRACEKAVSLAPLNVTARNRLGRLHLELGRLDEATEQLRKSLEIRPTAEAAGLLAEAHLLRGEEERAEPLLRQAIELEPFASGAHFRLGTIYAARGRHAEAIREFEAGLQTDPNNAEALAALRKLRAQ